MDVHPTKNGINRYWSIVIWLFPNKFMAYFAYFMDHPTIKFKGNFMEKMGVAENK